MLVIKLLGFALVVLSLWLLLRERPQVTTPDYEYYKMFHSMLLYQRSRTTWTSAQDKLFVQSLQDLYGQLSVEDQTRVQNERMYEDC